MQQREPIVSIEAQFDAWQQMRRAGLAKPEAAALPLKKSGQIEAQYQRWRDCRTFAVSGSRGACL